MKRKSCKINDKFWIATCVSKDSLSYEIDAHEEITAHLVILMVSTSSIFQISTTSNKNSNRHILGLVTQLEEYI